MAWKPPKKETPDAFSRWIKERKPNKPVKDKSGGGGRM